MLVYIASMYKEIEDNIAKTVSSYPKHLRADLSQELWLIALERLPFYDPSKGSIASFLYLRFKGHCKDWTKKNIKQSEELSDDMLIDLPIDLDTPTEILSPGAQNFIVDKLADGYTMKEIFVKFPEEHGYKSIKSLYNQLY